MQSRVPGLGAVDGTGRDGAHLSLVAHHQNAKIRLLIDSASQMFGVMREETARRLGLKILPYRGRGTIVGWDNQATGVGIVGRACMKLEIQGMRREYGFWVTTEAGGYDGILGGPWLEDENALLDQRARRILIRRGGVKKELRLEDVEAPYSACLTGRQGGWRCLVPPPGKEVVSGGSPIVEPAQRLIPVAAPRPDNKGVKYGGLPIVEPAQRLVPVTSAKSAQPLDAEGRPSYHATVEDAEEDVEEDTAPQDNCGGGSLLLRQLNPEPSKAITRMARLGLSEYGEPQWHVWDLDEWAPGAQPTVRINVGGRARIAANRVVRVAAGQSVMQKGDFRGISGKLPDYLSDMEHAFRPMLAGEGVIELPPHTADDTKIEFTEQDKALWPQSRLRQMSHQHLQKLREILDDLLAKGFIRPSSSEVSSPILFVAKPDGGIRMCCDYTQLNKVIKKDRYPLPLITDTLREVGKAKYITKLDITAAFHRVRIREGDEWKTAFITRYGLFEWLVTPFGLSPSPASFQRYINHTLHDLLDRGVSAYVDDVIVYSDDLEEHRRVVREVLRRLHDAGLPVDFKKCAFEAPEVKFLGVIMHAGKGISMDPEKVAAIVRMELPRTVKEVRRFLGLCGYLRLFISRYSDYSGPISELMKGIVKKGDLVSWNAEARKAFYDLKKLFQTTQDEGGILRSWVHGKDARLETDASTWAVGGQLMQEDEEEQWRPVAFYSKKLSPAEANYSVHDKEMLAVIRCLDEWDVELRGSEHVTVITDHQALEAFQRVEKRRERHMRWKERLTDFPGIRFEYRPGSENAVADALSRQPGDHPAGEEDERRRERVTSVLPEGIFVGPAKDGLRNEEGDLPSIVEPAQRLIPVRLAPTAAEMPAEELWARAVEEDPEYRRLRQEVASEIRQWNAPRPHNVSISECVVEGGMLKFRGRRWVPDFEPLRTRILTSFHDGLDVGHPGREAMLHSLSQEFFWPKQGEDVRRYVRSCDVCGRTRIWREKAGLLKPLPIADRPWRHLTMDYAVQLPRTAEGFEHVLLVVDRLTKGVELLATKGLDTEEMAKVFLEGVVRHHGFPSSIISDRGGQFVGGFWSALCRATGVKRKPSTAFHPETDGQSERMVQEFKAYLRRALTSRQAMEAGRAGDGDWLEWLPFAQLALNSRVNESTGFSPFFLTHGTNPRLGDVDPAELEGEVSPLAPARAGAELARRLTAARQWTQAALATSQQDQEEYANRRRRAAPRYRVGDQVWLSLRHRDDGGGRFRPRSGRYQILEVINSHDYRLNTPPGTHDIFHTAVLRPANMDPFPSQPRDDWQPGPITTGEIDVDTDSAMYQVEAIVGERTFRRQRQVLVKWVGWHRPTWEPRAEMVLLSALADWEALPPEERSSRSRA